MCYEVDACGVGVEVGEHLLTGVFLGSDGGVVDQNVEAAVSGLDGFRSSGDAGIVGLVYLQEFAGAFVAFGLQILNGSLSLVYGAGADEDVVDAFGQ